jgi:hypothetical protein
MGSCLGKPPKAVRRLFQRPLSLNEVSGAVDYSHHLCTVGKQTIKRQPTVDNKRACIFGNFRARAADLGMLHQEPTTFLNAIIDLVGDSF